MHKHRVLCHIFQRQVGTLLKFALARLVVYRIKLGLTSVWPACRNHNLPSRDFVQVHEFSNSGYSKTLVKTLQGVFGYQNPSSFGHFLSNFVDQPIISITLNKASSSGNGMSVRAYLILDYNVVHGEYFVYFVPIVKRHFSNTKNTPSTFFRLFCQYRSILQFTWWIHQKRSQMRAGLSGQLSVILQHLG
jgi:hypothetical protein